MFLISSMLLGWVACGQSAVAKAEKLSSQSNHKEALPIYLSLLESKPKDTLLLRQTGYTYGQMEQYEKATKIYERLLAANESNANYHFYYGGSMGLWAKNASKFKALGLLDDVKYHLKKAADLDSKHIETRWALVQLYVELPGIIGGSISTSRKYARELQAISPVDGYLATGFIEEYEKEYKAAEAAYKKAIDLGGSPLTYQKLATLYSDKMDREQDARLVLEKAIRLHNDKSLKQQLKKLNSR